MTRLGIARSRGMTLFEIVVAVSILTMVAVLIYGVVDSLSRGRKGEGLRSERAHEGREALQRIVRDLSSAYLSTHTPVARAQQTERTALVGREQTPIDLELLKGGIVNVVAENVSEFDLHYLDPTTGQWLESWDSMQVSGQPNRLPLAVSVRIVLKGIGEGPAFAYETKVFLPIQQPLSFGIPRP